MAQVIKYQQGGSTPTQKYGTFTIDGNQYQVDDDFLFLPLSLFHTFN